MLQVNAEAQRISREADQANAIAAECQAGLDKALPALAAAEEALNVLTKKDMSELKVRYLCRQISGHADVVCHENVSCKSLQQVWLMCCLTHGWALTLNRHI